MTETARNNTAIQRFLIAGLAIPVLVVLASITIQLIIGGDLPDPMAVHFGAGGRPDGFASPIVSIALTAAVGLGIPVLFVGSTLGGLRNGGLGGVYRVLGTTSAGIATMMALLTARVALAQKGLADARDAHFGAGELVLALAVTAVVSAIAWFIQPADTTDHTRRTRVTAYELKEGERAVWLSEASMSGRGVAVMVLAMVALWVGSVITWMVADDPASAILMVVVAVIVTILVVTTTTFRIRVDEHGLSVRSPLGMPRYGVAIADIESVSLIEVNPIGDFGGYGLRRVPGRFAVALRAGQAIEIKRSGGPDFVVTARDSATGVALLMALKQRRA